MPAEVVAFTQFGVAGLVCFMWLAERRAASVRERQITELHERLMSERRGSEVVITALNDNTRALASLEASQRGLLALLGRLGPRVGEAGEERGAR